MTLSTTRLHACALCIVIGLSLVACSRGDDADLWKRDIPADAVHAPMEIDGLWEGDVAMGGVRILIEPARVTLALRCDGAGRKLAQASAPVARVEAPGARLVLQEDLAGGDDECGFRFMKDNEFAYGLSGPGVVEIAFAGASVSRLRKRADLAASR